MMTAGKSNGGDLVARCERLQRELERSRLAVQAAEKRIRSLVEERDALARTNQELSRRVEAAGAVTQAQWVELQEPDAIGQVACSIAHDFNNVLAVITSGLELLARTDQPERRARLIKRIEEAAWRGGDLTRRLQALARQSGETAQVESRAGEGSSSVSILLPGAIRSQGALEHLSVLVVEDDDEMAALVTDMLERVGHRGVRVSTVPAAVGVLSAGEAVDLIFADVLLSAGGSGFDLAREIERRKLRLPIVLTSGFGEGMRGRLAAARLPFLPKPYTLTALQQVLQQARGVGGPAVSIRAAAAPGWPFRLHSGRAVLLIRHPRRIHPSKNTCQSQTIAQYFVDSLALELLPGCVGNSGLGFGSGWA